MARDKSFLNRTIYQALQSLYTHYNRDVDITEKFTDAQKQQQINFVKLLGQSPIIRELHGFLKCKGMLSVRLTGVVAHWQKVRDCFLKVIVPDRLCLCISVCVARYVIRNGHQG